MESCKLRSANGIHDAVCDGEDCIFWRIAEHAGLSGPSDGCALQYFELLEGGREVSRWLLSVKSRVAASQAEGDSASGAIEE